MGRATVAELPAGIGPPAPEAAIDVDGAGVRWSSGDLVMVTGQGGLVASVISGAGRAVAYRSHRVDGVCVLSGDRSRDLARCGIHREAIRQRRRDCPCSGPTLKRVVEPDRFDRLALHDRVRVICTYFEVNLEFGYFFALFCIHCVGLIQSIDRWSTADGAVRDVHARRESRFDPPRDGL